MLRRSEKFYSFIKKCKWGGVILGFGIAISSLYVLDLITAKISLAPEYSSLLIERFSPLPLITAIGIFSIFSGFTFHSKIINRIASSAFSIYLISEHPSIYPWLWKKYFNNMVVYDNTFNLIAYSFIQCLIVMMFCIIIDIIYKWFKQFLFSLIDLNTGN